MERGEMGLGWSWERQGWDGEGRDGAGMELGETGLEMDEQGWDGDDEAGLDGEGRCRCCCSHEAQSSS